MAFIIFAQKALAIFIFNEQYCNTILGSPAPHTIMDMRNNKRHNILTHARVNFSQSETSSLLRGEEGGS